MGRQPQTVEEIPKQAKSDFEDVVHDVDIPSIRDAGIKFVPFGVLQKITTRGDVGAAGLGLAIGYFTDAILHPTGVPPGTASLYSAAAAVGIKNMVQAWRESRRHNEPTHQETTTELQRHKLRQTAERLLNLFQINGSQEQFDDLKLEVDLWDSRVIGDEGLRATMKTTFNSFQKKKSLSIVAQDFRPSN
jgi:hypothetical protein